MSGFPVRTGFTSDEFRSSRCAPGLGTNRPSRPDASASLLPGLAASGFIASPAAPDLVSTPNDLACASSDIGRGTVDLVSTGRSSVRCGGCNTGVASLPPSALARVGDASSRANTGAVLMASELTFMATCDTGRDRTKASRSTTVTPFGAIRFAYLIFVMLRMLSQSPRQLLITFVL
jgi:hypothetical protein